ncbi:arabinogalactan endo-1,4-beta-galactosidase [Ferruginibacter lapsinanis]|uniref:glycoside hydrolase family 53 protein n=1 Tax=Ferruginibacter lapsinanis TaxID=563172 RepID=UPI001E2E0ABD|nr:glycosyl hydrolase 53 family protein [Ferruginibacter lapsinanis]UEG51200.1 arabinogalactan endo-1,4-beta-galactosidase [Ferruginibacter lapsinanis]
MRNISVYCLLLLSVVFTGCSKKIVTTNTPLSKIYSWTQFSMGADLSYATQMLDKGVVYKDAGVTKDIFTIFKDHGCNTVRLKLWHTPKAYTSTWGGNDQEYNDLPKVEMLIKKAKDLGMAVNLDLHYSDTWADPQRQEIPAAWKGLTLDVMKDSVYQYTMNVLNELKKKNLVPEMIQVGNETNIGVLWPVGQVVNNDYSSFAKFLNAGIKAVRDFSVTSTVKPKIILHVAQLQHAVSWTKGITEAGVTDFDIIGLSHYADWSTMNTMPEITALVSKLRTTYNKKVMLVEIGYWFDAKEANGYVIKQTPVDGYPFTIEGQYKYLKDVTQAVINGGGSGVQYWAPDYMGTGGEMTVRSLVDANGNVLPGINFMNFPYKF